MSKFKQLVETILKEQDLYDIESIDTTSFLLNYQTTIDNESIKRQINKAYNKISNYLDNITPQEIRKILTEKNNTKKRIYDIKEIEKKANLINNCLMYYASTNTDFLTPKSNAHIKLKTIPSLPNIILAPKNNQGVASYDFNNDELYIYILNSNGTYNPVDFIDLLANNNIYNILVHELTHKQDFQDTISKSSPFKISPTTHNKDYSNNPHEVEAFTNQIISYIESNLRTVATNIRNAKSKAPAMYPWKNAISDAINQLLNELYNTSFGNVLKNMSDNTLKKLYRTIYEYFYERYFIQYLQTNTEQYNQELKNIDKNN